MLGVRHDAPSSLLRRAVSASVDRMLVRSASITSSVSAFFRFGLVMYRYYAYRAGQGAGREEGLPQLVVHGPQERSAAHRQR